MTYSVPPSARVDVLAFGRLFDDTTNSYKLIFFQSILNLLKQKLPQSGSVLLKMDDLAVEMAALAWYPHAFFRLSFGSQDQMGKVLDNLRFTLDERALAHADTQDELRLAIREQYEQIGLKGMLRYVPYRLLSPFFADQRRGMKDAEVKKRLIRKWSEESYESENPALYRFVDADKTIEIHPRWVAYLTESLPIVIGWAGKHWIDYLQSRNPNTPSIPNKTSPPLIRAQLISQTAYWRAIIKERPLNCLYSGDPLNPRKLTLDHFIPWSFVCHDQLWNLIPVSREVNCSKSNCLPSESYLDEFIELQLIGLTISRRVLDNNAWAKVTEPFVCDLRIASGELLNPKRLRAAYLGVLPAMMSLAEQIGFSARWKH